MAGRVWTLAPEPPAAQVPGPPFRREPMGPADEFIAILFAISYVLLLGASLFVIAGRIR